MRWSIFFWLALFGASFANQTALAADSASTNFQIQGAGLAPVAGELSSGQFQLFGGGEFLGLTQSGSNSFMLQSGGPLTGLFFLTTPPVVVPVVPPINSGVPGLNWFVGPGSVGGVGGYYSFPEITSSLGLNPLIFSTTSPLFLGKSLGAHATGSVQSPLPSIPRSGLVPNIKGHTVNPVATHSSSTYVAALSPAPISVSANLRLLMGAALGIVVLLWIIFFR